MTRIEYIEEYRQWIPEKSMSVLEKITDPQFEKLVDVTIQMGNQDVGMDNEIVETQETLADWEDNRKNHWRECGKVTVKDNVVLYEDVQMFKGQSRISQIAIVDLGEFRVSIS